MKEVTRKFLTARQASKVISDTLNISGEYFLVDDRRGRHKEMIPYTNEGRLVLYEESDIVRFIAMQTKSSGDVAKHKTVTISDDVWFMGRVIADDGSPAIEIIRGAGSEMLSYEGAKDLTNQLLELIDVTKAKPM